MPILTFFKRLLPSVCLFCIAMTAYAKDDEKLLTIKRIRVLDEFDEKPIKDARLYFLEKDSVTLIDSLIVLRDNDLTILPERTQFVIRAEAPGYRSTFASFEVPRWARRVKTFDLPSAVYMWPSSSIKLNEVGVTASKILMVMKGDTIEYNAAALQLADGAMLENLIEALPGANIDESGHISINGAFVSSLLLNGRDFFAGDARIALQNLPAYTVSKVKLYRKDDTGRMTAAEKKMKAPLVADVRLKKEYAQGWVTNFEVGGGHDLGPQTGSDNGWLWMGRFFGLRYTNHSSLAVFGGSNNLSDPMKAGRKGQWSKSNVNDGQQTTNTGGIHFDIDSRNSPWSLNTDFVATNNRRIVHTEQYGENFYPSLTVITNKSSHFRKDNTELRWNASVKWRRGSSYRISFDINPAVSYLTEKNTNREETQRRQGMDELYTRTKSESMRYKTLRAGSSANMQYDLTKTLSIRLNLNGEYNSRRRYYDENDELRYSSPLQQGFHNYIDREMPDNSYRLRANMTFSSRSKRIGNFEHKGRKFSYIYSIEYGFLQRHESDKQTLMRSSCDDDTQTPSVNAVRDWIIDGNNTYHTTQLNREHTIRPMLGFAYGKDNYGGYCLRISLTPAILYSNRRINDLRNGAELFRSDNNWLFRPEVAMRWSDWRNQLDIKYTFGHELPNMLYLLDVANSTDPMMVIRGNSQLKDMSYQRLDATYHLSDKNQFPMFRAEAHFTRWSNMAGMARLYNETTGVTTIMPMNVNGNYKFSSLVSFNKTIRKWSVSNTLSYSQGKSVDFASATQTLSTTAVHSNNVGEELSVTYRVRSARIGVKGAISWTRQRSEQGLFSLMKYGNGGYGITFSMPVVWGISLDTDLMAYNRFGYDDPTMNTTDWVWNLRLQKSFGKANCFTLKATGFDILHQLSTVRREVNARGYTETRYNSMPSYAMLSLFYRLDIKPRRITSK